jgi:hypothetical protein
MQRTKAAGRSDRQMWLQPLANLGLPDSPHQTLSACVRTSVSHAKQSLAVQAKQKSLHPLSQPYAYPAPPNRTGEIPEAGKPTARALPVTRPRRLRQVS